MLFLARWQEYLRRSSSFPEAEVASDLDQGKFLAPGQVDALKLVKYM